MTRASRAVAIRLAAFSVDYRYGSHSEFVFLEQDAEKTRTPVVEGAESGEEFGS